VTHHVIRVEPDGTRVYSNYTRYRPRPDSVRVYARRKPDDPSAYFWGGNWFLPLEGLPEENRVMPPTRADSEAFHHMWKRRKCRCDVCHRDGVERWRRMWRALEDVRF
jgi:hypothetical protein